METGKNKMKVSEIMSRSVITVTEDTVISDFINLLSDRGINGVPVVDEKGKLCGIATKTDLLVFEIKRELSSIYENRLENIFREYNSEGSWNSFSEMIHRYNRTITVKDIMEPNVLTVDSFSTVQEICRTMKDRKLNHIIVMNNDEIEGIVTSRDIIGIVADNGI